MVREAAFVKSEFRPALLHFHPGLFRGDKWVLGNFSAKRLKLDILFSSLLFYFDINLSHRLARQALYKMHGGRPKIRSQQMIEEQGHG